MVGKRGAPDARRSGESQPVKSTPLAASLPLLLLCAALSGCVPGGSGAGCARISPDVEPSWARPGETFVLRGAGFGGGCDDSNLPFTEDPPQRGVRVEMRQGKKTWPLATVDAGPRPDYAIEGEFRVPEDVWPGKAAVVTRDDYGRMEVPFRVVGDGPR